MKTIVSGNNPTLSEVVHDKANGSFTRFDSQGNVTRSGRQIGGKVGVAKETSGKVGVAKETGGKDGVAKETGGKAAVSNQPDGKAAVANQPDSKAEVSNQPDGKASGTVVSTREQNEARQVDAMRKFGVDQMVMDKQSGKDFDRPAYQEMLGRLQSGDVLVVKSIDRLGRNYEEILEQWRIIMKEIGAAIVVLDMPLLDTRRGRDLTGTLIADIVLQLLSYVAETERAFIKQRQREGIAAAKSRGVRFGLPEKAKPEGFEELAEEWKAGRISAREAGRRLGGPHTTFLKWVRSVKNNC